MLRQLFGRPMIAWVIDVARRAQTAGALDAIAVATSTEVSDDALASQVAALGIPVYRGPLNDVAQRLLDAATAMGADAFVRINGDSPLLDTALILRAVALFRATACDLATNVLVRSFPKGQSVEVVSCAALRSALLDMTSADEREHVTQHFYRNQDRFQIAYFSAEQPAPQLQMSVDTPEDFARCEAVIASCAGDVASLGWRALADRFWANGGAS